MKKPANTAYGMMIAVAVLILPLAACGSIRKTPCRADIVRVQPHSESTPQQRPAPNKTAAAIAGNTAGKNDGSSPPVETAVLQDGENTTKPGTAPPGMSECLCLRK